MLLPDLEEFAVRKDTEIRAQDRTRSLGNKHPGKGTSKGPPEFRGRGLLRFGGQGKLHEEGDI